MSRTSIDAQGVMGLLPHRYPFLLVDKVISCEPGKSLTAIKNVTINEPFFQGHFPGRPIMPGVLIVEALAQACGLLAFETVGEAPTDGKVFVFVGIDKARFKKPVFPGDQLMLKVEFARRVRTIWKFNTTAEVDGCVVAMAELMVAPGQ
ncbi:MAG: 3-hydroxyacyl-ACP dehydratase FabZ [Gammaproteobacteria bacterium]|nr:3-hydroxyacyl-ACP dehydratase FabZ [Gammaproteobacteria bacterium]